MTKDEDRTTQHGQQQVPDLDTSSVYQWQGFSSDLALSKFDVFNKIIVKDISFGDSHSLFLTEDGEVFVRGTNDLGQLGLGSLDVTVVKEPIRLKDISDPVAQISCGKNHSAIVTDAGHVICWGSSKDGQCGTGSLDVVLSPTRVVVEADNGICQHGVPKLTTSEYFTQAACGASHTLALSNVGEVWAWGYGPQLGLGDLKQAPVPRRVEALHGRTVAAVCCGERHSMALVLRGEKKPPRSSPEKTRTRSVTNSVNTVTDDQNLSLCGLCNKEMFIVTDTSDMCIIETGHSCHANQTVHQIDSTLVDELTSSTSSEAVLRLAASSSHDSSHAPTDEAENRWPDTSGEVGDQRNDSSLLNDSNQMDSFVCDTSILVLPSEGLSDGEDPVEESMNVQRPSQLEGLLSSSEGKSLRDTETTTVVPSLDAPRDRDVETTTVVPSLDAPRDRDVETTTAVPSLDAHINADTLPLEIVQGEFTESASQVSGGQEQQGDPEDDLTRDRTLSVESEGVVWKRRSESEDTDEELWVLAHRNKKRSPSTVTVKSFDLSGAREYLQRQFEDERSAEGLPPGTERLKMSQTKLLAVLDTSQADQSPAQTASMAVPDTSQADQSPAQTASMAVPDTSQADQSPAQTASMAVTDSGQADQSPAQTASMAVTDSGQADQSSASIGSIFGYSASMLAQVKSATNKALTSMQAYSIFSPTKELQEMKNVQQPPSSIEMSSLPAGTAGHVNQTNEEGSQVKGQATVRRSGTFMEWSRQMSSVDDDPASLATHSDKRSLRTIEMQQKNLGRASLPSKLESQPHHHHVATATDVWVWGCNNQGQLGLGDLQDRGQPTVLKLFMGRHVIKLAAGESHSLALTANSQVFSWGSNSYGQLGQPEGVHAPARIKFVKGFMTWDVAAGSYHSLFLGDATGTHPDVLYVGGQPSKDVHSPVMKTSSPVSVAKVKQLHWVTRVMAGGPNCACKALALTFPEAGPVFELAASERTFYNQLIKTSNLLLRPMQRSNVSTLMEASPFRSLLQNMLVSFGALTKKIGEGITDLTRCIQASRPLVHSLILGSHSEFMEAFCSYSHSFSDFLAVGGFDYCTKTGSEFFEKIQDSISDLSDERDKMAASSLFLRAMRYPFFRLVEYSRIISRISVLVSNPETKSQLQSVVLDWDGLKLCFSSEHKMADTTRVFWETAVPKLAKEPIKLRQESDHNIWNKESWYCGDYSLELLRSPERRVLRDSKTHPLQMASGGKFTSRLFVLFNDIFLVQSTSMTLFQLETLWVESGTADEEQQNAITMVSPEDKLELLASTPAEKAEWLIALNSAISKVLTVQRPTSSKHSSGDRFTPPLVRHARHTFTKAGRFKDAVYDGTWMSGKPHGSGVLKWPDGSIFEGEFKKGSMHGSGTLTLLKNKGKEIQKGNWKDGKLHGLATVQYANRDLYKGFFQDGLRCGHGMYQAGHHKSSFASVYIGEWLHNLREGYGVHDDILKGEKYMGMWVEDHRHGSGVLVTLDGMYFEGTFSQDKLVGFGVMISDDNTVYEGDFMDITYLSGKGTLTLATGDKLEGLFTGTLNDGLKVNGTFIKSVTSPDLEQRSLPAGVKSKYFGRLGVHADAKWTDTFAHTGSVLGQSDLGKIQSREDTTKAWEVVAVTVSAGRSAIKGISGMSPSKQRFQEKTLEGLEKIPLHSMRSLNTQTLEEMAVYLGKACDCIYHPLGELTETLVNVFRASYIGIGAHPRLLHHAILEMKSYIKRLYRVIRILFPALPPKGGPVHVHPPSKPGDTAQATVDEVKVFTEGLGTDDPNLAVLTSVGLLYPILLPKIYPPLFDLYALYNEKSDDRYWERVSRLNRQSDMGLMAYLGIDQRFWFMEDILEQDKSQKLSTFKDVCYAEAVDTLQQLSTAFSPIEKLKIIEQTFNEITKTVTTALKDDHMWCMDDLFPIFQFVVVRAKIRHLGAEIHLVDDLIEPHLEHGEFGLMFTTLKACYFQIQNEKMPQH